MKVTLPDTPLVASSDHACVLASAGGSWYLYSSRDDLFYRSADPKADLEMVEERCREDPMRYEVDHAYIKSLLESGIEYLVLNVTDNCNLACRYCAYSGIFPGERAHGRRSVSTGTIDQALAIYASHSGAVGRKKIGFYGGEPLLGADRVWYAVERARAMFGPGNVTFFVTTNGTVSRPHIAASLAEAGFRTTVSLDGPSGVHDRFRVDRQGHPTWRRARAFIEELRDSYGSTFWDRVSLSVTIADEADLEQVRQFLETDPVLSRMLMHVGVVDWSRSNTQCDSRSGWMLPGHSYLDSYCSDVLNGVAGSAFIDSIFDPLLHFIWARPTPPPHTLWPAGACVPGARRLFVATNGLIHPCERVGTDFPLGHCRDGIVVDRAAGHLRDLAQVLETICRSCWARRLCSICLANARWGGRVDREQISGQCESIRVQLSYLLTAYLSVRELEPEAWSRRFRQPTGLNRLNSGGVQ